MIYNNLNKLDFSEIPQTSLLINKVIDHLESSEDKTAKGFIYIMDKIRTSNLELRERWAQLHSDLADEKKELENRIVDLNEKIVTFEDEIHDLKSEINSLEIQIDTSPSKYDY